MPTLVPVLLAGGTGTRLWPLSRQGYPKQFHKLLGDDSLLQATARRAARVPNAAPPIVICGDQHRFIVAEQLREIGIRDATIILEPEGRNTAPAATIAALQVAEQHGPDAQVFLMSADHAVANVEAFCAAATTASAVAAQDGRIVTFGIAPTRPETGYGYLKRGAELPAGGFEVAQFIEKPKLPDAQRYCQDEAFSWNGGLFLYPAGAFLEEVEQFEPDMLAHCRQALTGARKDLDFIRLDADAFKGARSESIDYAIMEKTKIAALVPMDAGWDDVGAWTFMNLLPTDENGNVTEGDVLLEDSRNNLVYADTRLVAAVGMENHIVVETKDAVLVAPTDRAQDVKRLVTTLEAMQRPETQLHPRVLRPWGSYETIAEGPRFQVKRIIVKPGEKLSLQMHHHRAEHWIVVCGTARVTRDTEETLITENQSVYIPLGTRHRLDNPGHVPLELIEVQSGSYLGEDDIVRFDDVYGRTPDNTPESV
ncbi:mannose-1-phosphate guanylyltransferase/mannose-6-phosphate isomerase [Algiphilus sp.]|uniref:mannose-1-phosphate guanylyltransferase/mannose-6-phosphate isomerase n=1 Tax=Algiphilus sp. TaxID=1872431 RepID=UPI003C343DD6